jgi:hypothetical protein
VRFGRAVVLPPGAGDVGEEPASAFRCGELGRMQAARGIQGSGGPAATVTKPVNTACARALELDVINVTGGITMDHDLPGRDGWAELSGEGPDGASSGSKTGLPPGYCWYGSRLIPSEPEAGRITEFVS